MKVGHVGLVVNPLAGSSADGPARAAAIAIARLSPGFVTTDSVGAAALRGVSAEVRVTETNGSGHQVTVSLARACLAAGVDAIVVVGGDGTMADVAGAILDPPSDSPVPIIGIGCGSTNAGGLVTCTSRSLAGLDPAWLSIELAATLLTTASDGAVLGHAFHDVVFGTTIVGTLDGTVCDVDAAESIRGQRVPGKPEPIGSPASLVEVRHGTTWRTVAEGEAVGGVVVGRVRPEFTGFATAGAACLTSWVGLPAGCIVSDRPIAVAGLTAVVVLDLPPVRTSYASLGDGSAVRVSGLAPGACVSLDGNPRRVLAEKDSIETVVRTAALPVARLGAGE